MEFKDVLDYCFGDLEECRALLDKWYDELLDEEERQEEERDRLERENSNPNDDLVDDILDMMWLEKSEEE